MVCIAGLLISIALSEQTQDLKSFTKKFNVWFFQIIGGAS